MKDDYTTNSRYLTHTSPLQKGWENVLFELRSEMVKAQEGNIGFNIATNTVANATNTNLCNYV